MNKLISIIIPCKNGTNYLKEAVDGIRRQQMNVEIIVVDDGSIDGTAALATELGCKVISHESSRGAVVAKNTGIATATGDYILFHDHDDVLVEDALKTFLGEFNSAPETKVVLSMRKDFLSPDAKNQSEVVKTEPYHGAIAGCVLFRRSVFDTIGPFDEKLVAGEAIGLLMKLKEMNVPTRKLDFTACLRRIHNTNYGKTNKAQENKDYAAILRAKLRGGG